MRMALTFDDGPNTVTTVQVLDVLKQYDVKASFFLIGRCINDETKTIIEREVKEGHSIENHSFSHVDMSKMDADFILKEINQTSELIKNVTGSDPQFFRPPYIYVNDLMYNTIPLPFICGRGVEDWVPTVTAEERARNVIEHAEDGQIVLLHDLIGNVNTVEALKIIIPELLKKGVEFMTIRDLFKNCNVNPNQKGVLWTNLF